ncbi:TIGR04222 domain-containing membrane protein [Streptomyces sp. NPDC000134]|jgi:hypothetical protein|uniref:TIGR04222 domain-containing membrane protein n=1 Tax=Streptomyces sp. NPDC000134 TaxID=3364536 RepID=UPI003698B34C
MDTGTDFGLEPYETALLAGGPRAAVTVAVVALRLRGLVETGPQGTLCAPEAVDEEVPPFVGTVMDCLREPLTVRELVRHPDVKLALALARIPLADAGLLGRPRLAPNRTARRRVAFLRERYPLPDAPHGLGDEDTLLAVALHGEAALRLLLPRFAGRAGLLSGPGTDPGGGVRPRRRGRFARRPGTGAYEDAAGPRDHSGGEG